MKQAKHLFCLVMAIAMLGLWSCSESGDYYDYVSDTSTVVMKLNMKTVMENSGFELNSDGIQTPQELIDILGHGGQTMSTALQKLKGVDPRNVMVVVPELRGSYSHILVSITDKRDFKRSLEDFAYTRQNGDIYVCEDVDDMPMVAIDGDIALLAKVPNGKTPQTVIDNIKKAATDHPVVQWKKDKLVSDDAMVVLLSNRALLDMLQIPPIANLYMNQCYSADWTSGYTWIETDLEGNKLEGSSSAYDSQGSKIKSLLIGDSADKSMLRYTSPKDFVVALMALDMDKCNSLIGGALSMNPDAAQFINPLLATLEGHVMLSFGYSNLHAYDFSATLAIKTKPGQANTLVDGVKTILSSVYVPYMSNGTGITVISEGLCVNIIPENDYVVASLGGNELNGSRLISQSDFDDDPVQLAAKVNSGDAAVTAIPLPFGVNIKLEADDEESEIEVTLTGTNQGFLATLISLAHSMQ